MIPLRYVYSLCLLATVLLIIPSPRRVHACPQFAAAPHSQWKVEAHHGVSWLITPCGERFLSLGVNVLDGGFPSRIHEGRLSYHWGTFYPDLTSWVTATHQRLTAWGFNTAGAWSLEPPGLPLPFIPNLELGRHSRFVWFDPFRPTIGEEMRAWAHQLITPYKGHPARIGYFTDNEIGWWYSALFVYYLQLPATNYTKQKIVTLLREHYANDWKRLTRDFVPPEGVTSFDALLQSSAAKTQLRVGGDGMQFVQRWTSAVAEQYYRLVHGAIRDADPEALIFSDRLQIYYDPNVVRPMAPYVDVIATNYNVDVQNGNIARYYFDGLQQLTGAKPVIVSEWFFAAHENRSGNLNNGHLMTVQTQAERTRGAMTAAQRFANLPQLVGLHWFQYYDHPVGGRPDGEDYNFGLVDLYDRPYEALTEAFSQTNPRLATIHQESRQAPSMPPPGTPLEIPEAAINPQDHSLHEWPLAQAFVPGLVTRPPEVIFGDIYLAWDHHHLYLATITMDYYDPEFLAFGETFPLEEAFRLDWGIDAGSGPQHFALYIVPPKVFPKEDQPSLTRAHFCRIVQGNCEPVPTASASYFGRDRPRIYSEVSLPWQVLGLDGPPPARQLRLELAATASHRARWMSWSGRPPAVGMQDTAAWHVVRLGKR